MNIKEINDILDQEIKFSSETPLIDTLDENFVDGFVKGLRQAKFLLNSFEEQVKPKPRPYAISLTTTTNTKEGDMLWMTPEGKVASYSTSGYINVEPEPIPNLNKILEKYDGIIITGARGSGKTITAMKIINYLMCRDGGHKRCLFMFPDSNFHNNIWYGSLTDGKYHKILNYSKYEYSFQRLYWKNGARAYSCFASNDNDGFFKGLGVDLLWLEEISKFGTEHKFNNLENAKESMTYSETKDRKVIITGTEYKEAMKGTWLEKLNLYTYNLNLPI